MPLCMQQINYIKFAGDCQEQKFSERPRPLNYEPTAGIRPIPVIQREIQFGLYDRIKTKKKKMESNLRNRICMFSDMICMEVFIYCTL